jgi:methionyl-tRNA synthetase
VDPLRYFLLREIGFEQDGNFGWERFDERYTADLADGLGNLVARSLAMIAKYRDGVVPEGTATELDRVGSAATRTYTDAMDAIDLRGGLSAAWSLVSSANQYIVQSEPWSLAKAGKTEELDQVLSALARCLFRLAVMTSPVMPSKAQEIWNALGHKGAISAGSWEALENQSSEGWQTIRPPILFPKPGPM